MIKLTKVKSSEWMGNGFGNANASWVVKGAEHISVSHYAGSWNAHDHSNRIASGFTRKDLIEILETKLSGEN